MSQFFNKTYDYCESTRNIDNMLEQFYKDRNHVLDLLKYDSNSLADTLWTSKSILCKDDSCIFNMGKCLSNYIEDKINNNSTTDIMLNYYVCPQCKNMKRIVDFSKTKIGEPFLIECGDLVGKQMIIKEYDVSKLYLIKEDIPRSVNKILMNRSIIDLVKCSFNSCDVNAMKTIKKYKEAKYLGLDKFTNNILINWYLQENLRKQGIDNIKNMYISYICNGEGYSLYEHSEIGYIKDFQKFPNLLSHSGKPSPTAKADDRHPIKYDVVQGIIVQLFGLLHVLRKYDFSHGEPTTKNISFFNQPISYLLDGAHINSPITMKINNFSHSGITIKSNSKNLRLYSKSLIAEHELNKRIYNPIIIQNNNTNEYYYKIKNPKNSVKESVLFMYVQHLGIPLYQASFDGYAFLINLMAESSFYSTVVNDKKLLKFWNSLWLPEEIKIINQRLSLLHDSPLSFQNINETLTILSNLNLRCNMIDFAWNQIKLW